MIDKINFFKHQTPARTCTLFVFLLEYFYFTNKINLREMCAIL